MGQKRDHAREQSTESTSIDELWSTSSPIPVPRYKDGEVKSAEEMFRKPKGGVQVHSQGSEGERSREVATSLAPGSRGEAFEPYTVGNRCVQIPEAGHGGYTSIEEAEELCRGEHISKNAPPSLNVVLHTNDLFDAAQTNASRPMSSYALIPIHVQLDIRLLPPGMAEMQADPDQFKDIKYKVVMKKDRSIWKKQLLGGISLGAKTAPQQPAEKQILHGVSGSVGPGEILAMMGPSGSGKTTMLNILGGRLPNEKITGALTYNGDPYTSILKTRIGYVNQDDILFPILTVRETLVFSALLRLSRKLSNKEKIERAETILTELGLQRCQNTIVGGPFIRGVSGGERKRTSIGYEILVEPSLLLLDEPTSGLDSSTALRILQVLRANAQVGRVIVATIHQPSSRIFNMFDKLMVLSEGHPIYFGEAKSAMDYFASLQFIPQLAMNPSDFLVDLASGITDDITIPPQHSFSKPGTRAPGSEQGAETEDYDKGVQFQNAGLAELNATTQMHLETISEDYKRQQVVKYLRLKYKYELEGNASDKVDLSSKVPSMTGTFVKDHWNSTWCEQFSILCRRNRRERRKDYLNLLRFSQGIAVAVLLGLLWWQPKLDTEQDIRDQLGLLFYISIYCCTASMWSTLTVFPLERNYIAKERASGMYSLSAYYLSSTCCDFVAELVHPALFTVVVYFMAGLKYDFITFGLTLLAVLLVAITAQSMGEFFGAATLSTKRVGMVSSMILLVFLLAGGYYVQNIPIWLRWIRYVSVVYYAFNLLRRIQYSPDQTYDCHGFGGCIRYDESPIFSGMNLNGGMRDAFALILMILVYKMVAYMCLRRRI